MEPTLFGIVFVVILVGNLTQWITRSRQLNKTFQLLAETRSGTLSPGGLWQRPSVRFMHDGNSVLVDLFSTRRRSKTRYTQLHIPWPDTHLRLQVYPEHSWNRLGKYFGMQDIALGVPQFDDRYMITGNAETRIRKLLSPAAQTRIEKLCKSHGDSGIFVGIYGGVLLIKKNRQIYRHTELQHFVHLGLELSDELSAANTADIEFIPKAKVAAEVVHPIGGVSVICQVCGEEIRGDSVACRSCKTPHHRDCWNYYGACSTYGCHERRYSGS